MEMDLDHPIFELSLGQDITQNHTSWHYDLIHYSFLNSQEKVSEL